MSFYEFAALIILSANLFAQIPVLLWLGCWFVFLAIIARIDA